MGYEKLIPLALAAGLTIAGTAYGQIAEFNFTGGSLADSANVSNLTVTDVGSAASGGTDGFNAFTSSTGWDEAAQVSGAGSFFAPTSQATAGDAITFTITAQSGFAFSITDFSFDARSTSNAPADIGFTINGLSYDFSGSYDNNSTITSISQGSLGFSGLSSATISIQGWNSTGSSELQLDNIRVDGSASPRARHLRTADRAAWSRLGGPSAPSSTSSTARQKLLKLSRPVTVFL